MRLVTFSAGGDERLGALLPDSSVLDVAAAWPLLAAGSPPAPRTMIELLTNWQQLLEPLRDVVDRASGGRASAAGSVLAPDAVRLLAPVPRPPRIRDYLTYESHAAGLGVELPPACEQMPICYKGNPLSVIGPEVPIPWPAYSDQLDFELELGFYVATGGVDLAAEEAAACVAGVTLFNDVSARDIQMVEMSLGIGPSKSKDFCNVMGPCLLTMDEVDEFAVELRARVNGEQWSHGTTGSRRFSFAEVLAWASYQEPVVPGEFLAVGTVGGGCGAELGRWIAPGDVVELEASGVGVLRNPVSAKQQARPGAGLASYSGAPAFVAPTAVGSEA